MKRHWNIRLPPQPDELLTSWLHRMAIANGYVDHSFCREMFGRHQIWTRDADRHFPRDQLPVLESWTGVSVSRLESMMLSSAIARMSGSDVIGGIAPWVLPLGVYHRVRRAFGVQFCPACLGEEPAYVRMAWRLAWVTTCPQHKCLLHDQCPGCGTPFMFHRTRPWLFGAIPCVNCGVDLSIVNLASSKETPLQASLEEGRITGWVVLGQQQVYSVAAFTGLRELARALVSKRTQPVRLQLGLNYQIPKRTQVERLGVSDRHEVIDALSELLDAWPSALLRALKASRLHPSFFWYAVEPTVHWLCSALDPIRPALHHEISAQEIAFARKELRDSGVAVTAVAVAKFLGLPRFLAQGTVLRDKAAPREK